jgi:F-box and WD-40 domain protein CDC4
MKSPSPVLETTEVHRPRSSQQLSISWKEPEDSPGGPARLQFEVAECVETKTITTTTTTKRSYPPLFVREPLSLDTREYPLATRATPPELTRFTLNLDPSTMLRLDSAGSPHDSGAKDGQLDDDDLTQDTLSDNLLLAASSRLMSKSTPESRPRRSNRPTMRQDSPSLLIAKKASRSASQASVGQPITDKSRRAVAVRNRDHAFSSRRSIPQLATPDTSESAPVAGDRPSKPRSLHLDRTNVKDTTTNANLVGHDVGSPTDSDSHTVFSSAVATPPITDTDLEPFGDPDESLQQSIRAHHRPVLNAAAAQDASLPSPRLSPTLAATQLVSTPPADSLDDEDASLARQFMMRRGGWIDESQSTEDGGDDMLLTPQHGSTDLHRAQSSIFDSQSMLESFDAMPNEMKTFMMYQFLRRCTRKTLRVVADVVTPALKCDFLKRLPTELSLHILSYLDHRDLCRAAQVSKHWRNIVDSNEKGWKDLFDIDGFELPPGELDKAIAQGWGWQDPVGPEGCELDLSLQNRMTSTETELRSSSAVEAVARPLRSSTKRKRGIAALTSAERLKRRANAQEMHKDSQANTEAKFSKSEGPIGAANAAAVAVPDPQLGMVSLRKLHLFKSLYRRHYLIRQSWTSGKVQPSHVAFAAHPRHVITCLQFDEDKIITGSDDTLIHVYDTKTGKLRKKLEGHEGGVWALQYEGNMLVSGSTDRSVRVWDIEKGLCTQVFYGHTSTVRCLQILMPTETGRHPDGRRIMQPAKPLIITGSRDSQLRVWRLPDAGSRRYIQTGPPANDAECPYFIRILAGHGHSVRAISAHADTLVSGSYDSTVRVWRISTGESLHVLQGHSQKVYSVVLDHKRNRCISGSMDSLVKIWDLDTGACLHTLEGHSLLVGLLDLRDDRLVSAAADSTLRIWDPENGKCKSTLMAHTGAITCFQHDGRKVISGSEKTVKMWDMATGECIQDLLTDLSGVWQVKFDERRCVAAVQRDNLTYVEVRSGWSRLIKSVSDANARLHNRY